MYIFVTVLMTETKSECYFYFVLWTNKDVLLQWFESVNNLNYLQNEFCKQ